VSGESESESSRSSTSSSSEGEEKEESASSSSASEGGWDAVAAEEEEEDEEESSSSSSASEETLLKRIREEVEQQHASKRLNVGHGYYEEEAGELLVYGTTNLNREERREMELAIGALNTSNNGDWAAFAATPYGARIDGELFQVVSNKGAATDRTAIMESFRALLQAGCPQATETFARKRVTQTCTLCQSQHQCKYRFSELGLHAGAKCMEVYRKIRVLYRVLKDAHTPWSHANRDVQAALAEVCAHV
jgi:hypothetical protein